MADGSSSAERWYTATELAGLPGLPGTERNVRSKAGRDSWSHRPRNARGGGREYSFNNLPQATQAALLLRDQPIMPDRVHVTKKARSEETIASAWQHYERASQTLKDAAKKRLQALHAVDALVRNGLRLMDARATVAAQIQSDGTKGYSAASIGRWQRDVKGVPASDWLALLVPDYVGRTATAECHPEAWAMFTALYLSRREPALSTCYRRVERAAQKEGWAYPSMRTLSRRIDEEFAPQEFAYLRGGQDALEKMFPAQTRDRSMFEAMDAVNGDGVLFVPWVIFPTGELARPKVWVWQCLGTGKILAWRPDVSENTDMLRLAFGDLVEHYGLPRAAYIDNTMAAANTVMTGGVRNRYRFPVKEESIVGIMPMCGVEVHFVKPAHGQSKPIERAFRDLRELIDHHPKYGRRGTKANPLPYADWLAIYEAEVAAHNAQTGRRGAHFAGRSFDQVFSESYARGNVRKATVEQRRLWLLSADKVTVNAVDGSVVLGRGPMGENRYWSESLLPYMGRKVVVRFDPQKLHDAVHVYTLTGQYLGSAECTFRAGFADSEAGRAYHRARGQFQKSTKAAAKAKLRMDELSAIHRVPDVVPPTTPAPAVIEGQFRRARQPAVAAPLEATGTDGATPLDSFMTRLSLKLKEQQL